MNNPILHMHRSLMRICIGILALIINYPSYNFAQEEFKANSTFQSQSKDTQDDDESLERQNFKDAFVYHTQNSQESEDSVKRIISKKVLDIQYINPEDQQIYHVLKQSNVYVKSVGGVGSRMEVSQRGSAGHQQGLYLDMIPLHNVRSQSLDLSLFPSSMLSQIIIQQGGDASHGGSGEQSGRLTLMPHSIPRGRSWAAQMQSSTERAQQLSLRYGQQGSRGGFALHVSVAGGDHAYLYHTQYQVPKRRVNADFAQLSTLGQAIYRTEWSSIKTLLGFGHLARGEPGPEGLDLVGRRSDQQFYYGGVDLRLKQIKNLSIQSYFTIHHYRFIETNPLWQSEAGIDAEYQDRRWGLESQYDQTYQWGQWGGGVQAQWTDAKTKTINAQQQQLAFILRHQWGLTSTLRLKKSLRLDMNTNRDPQWIPFLALEFHAERTLCDLRGSRAFRDPGFDEKYLRGPGLLANPDLRNEIGWWVDLGCQTFWKSKYLGGRQSYRWSAKLFKQSYDRMILYLPLDPYRVQASDELGSEIKGIEIRGKNQWTFKSLLQSDDKGPQHHQSSQIRGGNLRKIELSGHLTWQDHRLNVSPFTPLPLRPTIYSSVLFTLHTSDQLKYWTHWDMRNTMASDRFAFRTLPASSLWNVGVSRTWRVTPKTLSISLEIRNVLNQSTQDIVLRPLPARSFWIALQIMHDE